MTAKEEEQQQQQGIPSRFQFDGTEKATLYYIYIPHDVEIEWYSNHCLMRFTPGNFTV
jgi:hypothetical protein